MNLRRLTRNALLTAAALIVFAFEAVLPPLTPLPGVKPGLSNVITVYAMFALGPYDACMILSARILLSAMFSGNISALIYSATGGALCFLTMAALKRILSNKQIWVASVAGAAAHNLGQLLAALAVTRTPALLAYLPILMLSGMIAGLFTGLCAQYVINRIH